MESLVIYKLGRVIIESKPEIGINKGKRQAV